MTDRIVLANMQFQGRHGYYEHERLTAQPFEVDVELLVTLESAGIDDDLEHCGARMIVQGSTLRVEATVRGGWKPVAPAEETT